MNTGARRAFSLVAVACCLAFALALGAGALGAGAATGVGAAGAWGAWSVPLAFADDEAGEPADEDAELPETITVQFRQGIGVLGSVGEASLNMTVEEAFAQANIERPSAEGAEGEFKGWAAEKGASKAYRSYLPLSEAYKQAGSEGILLLYPVFGPVTKPHVKFYGQDGKTLLAESDIESWQTLNGSGAAPSLTIKDADGASALRKLGYSFVGWVDESGLLCYGDAPLTDDVSFTPSYEKLGADLSKLKHASADVSEAYLVHEDLERSLGVGFALEKASSPDESLVAAAAEDGCMVANSYRVSFGFQMDDERTLVHKGFGSITVKMPAVSQDGTRVRVYWLKIDGTVGKTAVQKVDQGAVTLKLTNYAYVAGGNVAISSKVPSSKGSEAGENQPRAGTIDPNEMPSDSPSQPGSGVAAPAAPAGGDSGSSSRGGAPAITASGRGGAPVGSSSSGSGGSGSGGSNGSAGAAAAQGGDGDEAADTGDDAYLEATDEVDGDDALSATASLLATQHGTKDGGLLYGASMLLIAAVAAVAWWLAFKREKKRDSAPESAPESTPASAEGTG